MVQRKVASVVVLTSMIHRVRMLSFHHLSARTRLCLLSGRISVPLASLMFVLGCGTRWNARRSLNQMSRSLRVPQSIDCRRMSDLFLARSHRGRLKVEAQDHCNSALNRLRSVEGKNGVLWYTAAELLVSLRGF